MSPTDRPISAEETMSNWLQDDIIRCVQPAPYLYLGDSDDEEDSGSKGGMSASSGRPDPAKGASRSRHTCCQSCALE